MPYKNIIWPTDLSEASAAALSHVTKLSQSTGATIHLLYVAEDVHRYDHYYGDANQELLDGLQTKIIQDAERMLDDLCQKDLHACPAFQRHVVVGDAADEILKLAAGQEDPVIILTNHGQGFGTQRAHVNTQFGSVAGKVVQSSPQPVLVVKLKQ